MNNEEISETNHPETPQEPTSPEPEPLYIDDKTHVDCLFHELTGFVTNLYEEAATQSLGMKVTKAPTCFNNYNRKYLTA